MYTGDLKPDLKVILSAAEPVDATTASDVRILGQRDDVVIFDREPASVAVDGDTSVVTMVWESGDTDQRGRIGIEVEVMWSGSKPQTFRADGGVDIFDDFDSLTFDPTPPVGGEGANADAYVNAVLALHADTYDTVLEIASEHGGTLNPRDFGAVNDGVADDTVAVRACFDAANAKKRQAGNYADPGATVVLRGKYKLTTLTTPIDVMCNLDASGAELIGPGGGYTGTVLSIGHATTGQVLQHADIKGPSVIGATVANMAALPVGSTGVIVRNLYSSHISVGKIYYFEDGLRVGGESHGVAYNEIAWGQIAHTKRDVVLKALDANGWSNQNTYIAGSVTGISAWTGGNRAAGKIGVLLDGTGSNTVTGNTFIGCSFESDVYDYVIDFKNAYSNQFYGCRHEQGVAVAAVTVSGSTITSNAHTLSVGDMVMFTGSAAPAGMSFDQPYFVISATTNTFTVGYKRGGTAITFTSAGTAVGYFRPQRIRFDTAINNAIELPVTPVTWLDQVYVGTPGAATTAGNLIRYSQRHIVDAYAPPQWPVHRARNRFTSGNRILWAAYPSSTSPVDDPTGWTAGLSDIGLHFATSGAETGWISASSAGVLKYQKPADTSVFELASCRRTQSAVVLASGTTYNAGTRTTGTVALTGASVGDYANVAAVEGLIPLGLRITAAVTSTGTITYAIDNLTASNITLAAVLNLYFMATRRFF